MAKKEKVLFIGPTPPPYSGPELGMKLFLKSKLNNKYNIVFIKTNLRTSNKYKGKLDLNAILSFFIFFSKLISAIIRHRPKVAYYPITATELGWVGRDAPCLLFCRLFAVKTIIHMRGSHFNLNFKMFRPLSQRLVRFACRGVFFGIVQSERLRNQFNALLPPGRVRVLYQAIDTSVYDDPDPKRADSMDVLFMGNLTHAKGYCDLLRCIPLVAAAIPQVRFLFAGTKLDAERNVFFNQYTGDRLAYEDPTKLEESLRSGIYAPNYKFLGIIKGAQKLDWMRRSAIFVLPSYSEGFSRALLEAMSLGIPVICTPVGAHAELIQDAVNGYLIEPGNVGLLAEKIIGLIQNVELRRKIGQANYQYVRHRFDINRIAEELSTLIDQAIIKGSSR